MFASSDSIALSPGQTALSFLEQKGLDLNADTNALLAVQDSFQGVFLQATVQQAVLSPQPSATQSGFVRNDQRAERDSSPSGERVKGKTHMHRSSEQTIPEAQDRAGGYPAKQAGTRLTDRGLPGTKSTRADKWESADVAGSLGSSASTPGCVSAVSSGPPTATAANKETSTPQLRSVGNFAPTPANGNAAAEAVSPVSQPLAFAMRVSTRAGGSQTSPSQQNLASATQNGSEDSTSGLETAATPSSAVVAPASSPLLACGEGTGTGGGAPSSGSSQAFASRGVTPGDAAADASAWQGVSAGDGVGMIADQASSAASSSTPAKQPTVSLVEASEGSDTAGRPVRNVHLQLAGAGDQKVELRLIEHAGGLSVSVRASDSELTRGLREQLPELSARLEANNYQGETWLPAAEPAGSSSGGHTPQQSADGSAEQRDSSPHGGQPQNRDGENQRNSQSAERESPAKSPVWLDSLLSISGSDAAVNSYQSAPFSS